MGGRVDVQRRFKRSSPRPHIPRSIRRYVLLFWLGLVAPVAAQVPDTTHAPRPDSARVEAPPADSIRAVTARADTTARRRLPPVGFAEAGAGVVLGDTLPVRQPVLDATGLLADVPGSFVYAFGTPGWPEAWSPFGLAPHRVGLFVDERPFDDLLTGAPRYDLLPLAYAGPLRVEAARLGRAAGVHARLRAYDLPQPLTELHYLSGGMGLQSIDAVHVQNRRSALLGGGGMLQVLGAYSGRAAEGAYPGSRLRKARQSLARVRYARPGWAFELVNLHNRRHVGAHGGVLPFTDDPDDYDTIFETDFAQVARPRAERHVVRNDLAATVRALLLPGLRAPFTASAYWTAQSSRYRDEDDTLSAGVDRYGLRAAQALPAGRHRLHLRVDAWLDVLDGDTLTVRRRTGRSQFHVSARDSLPFFGAGLVVEAGAHAYGGGLHGSGALRLERRAGAGRLFAVVSHAGQPASWIETQGFGAFVVPAAATASGRTDGAAGFGFRAGAFDALVFGFASRDAAPRDLFATPAVDTVAVRTLAAPLYQSGLAADLGWRRTARRGFYATVQPTGLAVLNPGASADHRRLADAWPLLSARGRFGMRYLLFRGDLDLDLSLRARFWTTLRSRELHPQTGLLVAPLATARTFGPAGVLDVVAEAGVRTAKFFFAYENALSGTPLMPGTLLVPDYPLPGQVFRFGVYWPILN